MKTMFFAVALVITLSLSAAAAEKPLNTHLNQRGSHPSGKNPELKSGGKPQPPTLCSPCLFYGGDLNPTDANADGFSDENTLLIVGGSQTYGAVNIPAGANASVTGVLVNILATAAFDPYTGVYDVRQGVSEGSGGTDVAGGSAAISVVATGRVAFGLYEYTIAVSFPTVTLVPGEYWVNLQPQCTNTLDGSCSVFRQYASNTTQETNAINGTWQPNGEIFFNSTFTGFGIDTTWVNWCDSSFGTSSEQCADLSFGLIGAN